VGANRGASSQQPAARSTLRTRVSSSSDATITLILWLRMMACFSLASPKRYRPPSSASGPGHCAFCARASVPAPAPPAPPSAVPTPPAPVPTPVSVSVSVSGPPPAPALTLAAAACASRLTNNKSRAKNPAEYLQRRTAITGGLRTRN
jgi:hypothetical protein